MSKLPFVNAEFQSQKHDTIAAALLVSSVLFYARATSTSGSKGERGSVDIRKKLTAEQKIDHHTIVAVRNKSIAHVYEQEQVAEALWHRQFAFLYGKDGSHLPAIATNNVTLNSKVAQALSRQLPIALPIIIHRFHFFMRKIAEILNTVDNLSEKAELYLVDPLEFFESEQMAKAVMADPKAGSIGRIAD